MALRAGASWTPGTLMSLNPKKFHRSWLHTEHDPEGPPPDTGTRWRVFRLVVVLAFLVLLGRLWQLQVIQASRFERAAAMNRISRIPIEAQRGVLYDRAGTQLTNNIPLWNVSLTLADMPEDEAEYQAALQRLERRLNLGGVVAIEAAELSESDRTVLVDAVSRALRLPVQDVRAAVDESQADGDAVLLAEGLTPPQMQQARQALGSIEGVRLMLAVQWRVEHGESRFRSTVIKENIGREAALAIESERLLVPGVSIQQAGSRSYPQGAMLSSVIGYVGKISQEQVEPLQQQARRFGQRPYALDEMVGKTGLESALEPYLRGKPGAQEVEVTSTGRVVRQGELREPTPGHNVTLTIDARLQEQTQSLLSGALRSSGAKSGAAVVLAPRTGQVLALVSLPSYDNNLFIGGISQRDYRRLQEDPGNPLLNKAIAGQYGPGSVLKPFVAAGALAERIIDPSIAHPCQGSIEVPSPTGSLQRQVFRDSNPRRLGPQTVIQALANDCDTFFYIVAGPEGRDNAGRPLRYYEPGGEDATPFRGLGPDRLNRYLRNFGLGRLTGIDLPGEAGGLVADQDWKLRNFPGNPWTLSDTLETAAGKGYTLVTPLQVATATAAVVNGGTVYRPQLVLKVTDARGGVVVAPAPEPMGSAGMTPDHLQTVREGMVQSVQAGALVGLRQRGLLPEGVQVGALAGSRPSKPGSDDAHVLWTTAFAGPAAPEVVVAVVLDGVRSREGAAASTVAAGILEYKFQGEK
ncbi:MAG: penicillin-binding transpeptidase domain-containing protein [Chloroflexota bacterium]|nr:penicillin-binding transpeptidase domain-containing protein [Chloroflexota bacterium]